MQNIVGIIPARFASTRFPGKPLANILGKSMIQRVYEQAKKSNLLVDIFVATDDERIYNHVEGFGAKAIYTTKDLPSGTDRCYEALTKIKLDIDYVINIQGDEPFIDPTQINLLADACDNRTELATLMIPCTTHNILFDDSEVKITFNKNNEALYFSRSVIPNIKGKPQSEWHKLHTYYRHAGLYAYRVDILKAITKLEPSPLELLESLEQLRWIENGYKIKCIPTNFESYCIDLESDIEKVLRIMGKIS